MTGQTRVFPKLLRFGAFILFAFVLWGKPAAAQFSLIPMDDTQSDHLRAYGVAYWALEAPRDWVVEWVLNYRGGAFIVYNTDEIKRKCILEGVTVESLSQQGRDSILKQIESSNMELVTLEKAPKVAIYAPPNHEPWDDAVTLALEYSKIPYDKIWDPEVLSDEIQKYDWVHLHHEDFTGQYGKFYRSFRNAPWYRERVRLYQQSAKEAGFDTVAEHKRAVTVHIANYVSQGGFLFAMCSACDTIDIALSAEGIDIIEPEIDGTPMTAGAQDKLRYDNCLMFEDFTLYPDPMRYEFSNIDCGPTDGLPPVYQNPRFGLIEFSAKHDPVPSMLTQCHVDEVPEFRGQTSAFRKEFIKDDARVLGEFQGEGAVKYVHRNFGEGTVTFLGGHDPEDYEHIVGEPATDLSLHKNSPGYRLILNNILFPAAKKKQRET
ncbi:MAG: asparagine synthetase B [Candidatus Omnitrophica bacterium]|nr:asparagine synthetase B [Candidatus Omnitrophota bacterium]